MERAHGCELERNKIKGAKLVNSIAECYLVFCFVDAVINGFLCKNEYKGRDIWNEQIEINDEFIKWIVDNLDNATDNGFNDLMGY